MPRPATRPNSAGDGWAPTCSRGASLGTSHRPTRTSERQSATAWASDGSGRGNPPADTGDQHSDVLPVALVIVAEQVNEVTLLVADCDQHIDRHPCREQQVAEGHVRRCPEG